MATIKNLSLRTQVVILDHEYFRTAELGWKRFVATVSVENGDGNSSYKSVGRSQAGSLTLLPGASVSGLHAAIVKVPQVASGLAQRPPLYSVVESDSVGLPVASKSSASATVEQGAGAASGDAVRKKSQGK